MRSLVCRSYGTSDGLAVETLPDPIPGYGEVLVRLTASNVAFVDRLIVRNPQHLARTLKVVLNRLARGVLHMPKPHLVALEELPRLLLGPVPSAGLVRTVVLPLDVQPEQTGPDQPPGRSQRAVPVQIAHA